MAASAISQPSSADIAPARSRPRHIRSGASNVASTSMRTSHTSSKPGYDATLYIPLVRADVTDKVIFQTLRKMNIGFIGKITLTAGGYVRGGHSFSRALIPIRWNTNDECTNFRNQLASQPHVRVFYSQTPPLFWKVSLMREDSSVKTLANGGGTTSTLSESTTDGRRSSRPARTVSRHSSNTPTNTNALRHLLNAALARIIALEQRVNESGLALSPISGKGSSTSEYAGVSSTTSNSVNAAAVVDTDAASEGKDDELSIDERESIVADEE